jgi:hypothetical protein
VLLASCTSRAPVRVAALADAGPEGCPSARPLPALGVVDAIVDEPTTQRWIDYRREVDEQRVAEEVTPAIVRESFRLEERHIELGCVNLDSTVDVGRALFQRTFTVADGWGNGLSGSPARLRRFQEGRFGGPDALTCQSCHWKGAAAGGGDRADNAYQFGDGDDLDAAEVRNPPALWGSGWVEIAAQEMSAQLKEQAEGVRQLAIFDNARVTRPLAAKGVSFGNVTGIPDGDGGASLDLDGVIGVDQDLVVKPFGWKGTFTTLREFIGASLQLHMGLQAEEIVAVGSQPNLELGGVGDDPDADGVVREITEGQLTALVLYVATLDVPPLAALDEGPYREPVLFSNGLEIVRSPEYSARWIDGFARFGRLGCATCHVPFVRVDSARYQTRAPLSGHTVSVDLERDGARPIPDRDDDGRFLVPAFSDFKRHDMGPLLTGRRDENGVPASTWFTRRLWGAALTAPYLHTGTAMTFDEAIAMHGGEAADAALGYELLDEDERVSVRLFLASLARAPSSRIR